MAVSYTHLTDHPLVSKGPDGLQCGVQLTGMMGVVVVNHGAMIGALIFQTAACTGKGGQCTADRIPVNSHFVGHSTGGQGIERIMASHHL